MEVAAADAGGGEVGAEREEVASPSARGAALAAAATGTAAGI